MLRLRMEMIFEGNNGRNRKEELHRPKVNRTNRIKPYKKSQTISQLLPKHWLTINKKWKYSKLNPQKSLKI